MQNCREAPSIKTVQEGAGLGSDVENAKTVISVAILIVFSLAVSHPKPVRRLHRLNHLRTSSGGILRNQAEWGEIDRA